MLHCSVGFVITCREYFLDWCILISWLICCFYCFLWVDWFYFKQTSFAVFWVFNTILCCLFVYCLTWFGFITLIWGVFTLVVVFGFC